jgi:hypothetical protein
MNQTGITEILYRQKTQYVVLTLDTDQLHTIVDGQFTCHESASQFRQVFHVCLKNETKVVTSLPYTWYTKLLQLWTTVRLQHEYQHSLISNTLLKLTGEG